MRALSVSIVIIGGIAAAGCNGTGGNLELRADPVATRAVPVDRGSDVLRPNDQLRVQVYDEPSISGDHQIDGSGSISVPLAGRVRAAGLTPVQLERAIALHLNRSGLKEPRVNVQVTTHAPFYIHGEVERSGEFPYRPGLTVMDAVAIAGGFTYRANERRAMVRRAGASVEESVPLDSPVPIYPGDNVRIAERFF